MNAIYKNTAICVPKSICAAVGLGLCGGFGYGPFSFRAGQLPGVRRAGLRQLFFVEDDFRVGVPGENLGGHAGIVENRGRQLDAVPLVTSFSRCGFPLVCVDLQTEFGAQRLEDVFEAGAKARASEREMIFGDRGDFGGKVSFGASPGSMGSSSRETEKVGELISMRCDLEMCRRNFPAGFA